jgi:hypothetical protein
VHKDFVYGALPTLEDLELERISIKYDPAGSKLTKFLLGALTIGTALAISPAALLGQSEDFTVSIVDTTDNISFSGSGTISTAQAYGYPAIPGDTATDGYLVTSFTGTLTNAATPADSGDVSLVASSNPGGLFGVNGSPIVADNLLFLTNDVTGNGTGYFDNWGLALLMASPNGNSVNLMTGTCDTYYCPAGDNMYIAWFNSDGSSYTFIPTSGSISFPAYSGNVSPVPEYGAMPMLALCGLGLAGGFLFKARQASVLLNT